MATTLRKENLGPLHDLLLKACPPVRKGPEDKLILDEDNGIQSIANLAKMLGMTAWGVHKWVKKNSIPPKKARLVTELSKGRVTLDEFSPFIFD